MPRKGPGRKKLFGWMAKISDTILKVDDPRETDVIIL
jgi:hypothetical protein